MKLDTVRKINEFIDVYDLARNPYRPTSVNDLYGKEYLKSTKYSSRLLNDFATATLGEPIRQIEPTPDGWSGIIEFEGPNGDRTEWSPYDLLKNDKPMEITSKQYIENHDNGNNIYRLSIGIILKSYQWLELFRVAQIHMSDFIDFIQEDGWTTIIFESELLPRMERLSRLIIKNYPFSIMSYPTLYRMLVTKDNYVVDVYNLPKFNEFVCKFH